MSDFFRIDPRIDLLGVLEYFSIEDIGWKSLFSSSLSIKENALREACIDYFSSFANHPAISFFRQLQQNGFFYDKPVRWMLYHHQFPFLQPDPVIRHPEYDYWMVMVRDFLVQSNWKFFWDSIQSEEIIFLKEASISIDTFPTLDVLEWFFGERQSQYSVIFSFIKAGCFSVFEPNRTATAILGAPCVKVNASVHNVIHELAHQFINTTIDLYWNYFQPYISGLNQILRPLHNSAYSNVRFMVYEYCVRAVESVLSPSLSKTYLENKKKEGFIFLPQLKNLLENSYIANRSEFTNFSLFIPEIASFFGHCIL